MDTYYHPENLASRFPMDMNSPISRTTCNCLRILEQITTETRPHRSASKDLSEALRPIQNFVHIWVATRDQVHRQRSEDCVENFERFRELLLETVPSVVAPPYFKAFFTAMGVTVHVEEQAGALAWSEEYQLDILRELDVVWCAISLALTDWQERMLSSE